MTYAIEIAGFYLTNYVDKTTKEEEHMKEEKKKIIERNKKHEWDINHK